MLGEGQRDSDREQSPLEGFTLFSVSVMRDDCGEEKQSAKHPDGEARRDRIATTRHRWGTGNHEYSSADKYDEDTEAEETVTGEHCISK